jgi:hypothetical protein
LKLKPRGAWDGRSCSSRGARADLSAPRPTCVRGLRPSTDSPLQSPAARTPIETWDLCKIATRHKKEWDGWDGDKGRVQHLRNLNLFLALARADGRDTDTSRRVKRFSSDGSQSTPVAPPRAERPITAPQLAWIPCPVCILWNARHDVPLELSGDATSCGIPHVVDRHTLGRFISGGGLFLGRNPKDLLAAALVGACPLLTAPTQLSTLHTIAVSICMYICIYCGLTHLHSAADRPLHRFPPWLVAGKSKVPCSVSSGVISRFIITWASSHRTLASGCGFVLLLDLTGCLKAEGNQEISSA